MIGYKTSLRKFKIKIIPSIFSDHNGLKLGNHLQEANWKIHRCVKIKQHATEKPVHQ